MKTLAAAIVVITLADGCRREAALGPPNDFLRQSGCPAAGNNLASLVVVREQLSRLARQLRAVLNRTLGVRHLALGQKCSELVERRHGVAPRPAVIPLSLRRTRRISRRHSPRVSPGQWWSGWRDSNSRP